MQTPRLIANNKAFVAILTLFVLLPTTTVLAQPQPDESLVATEDAAPTTAPAGSDDVMRPLTAAILSVTGKSVQYSIDNGETWEPAVVDAALSKDGVVRTGFASACEISFQGNTIVQVEALSSVRIADYYGLQGKEVVRASLQYGAVRCGVEKGRLKSDTKITTPVAALAIRGTITHVEYDRGTGLCNLGVLKDGPADAVTRKGRYVLGEGMKTDAALSRHLKTAIFGRSVSVAGNLAIGGATDVEATNIAEIIGAIDRVANGGAGDKDEEQRQSIFGGDEDDEDVCTDGECDPGPSE